MDQVSRFRVHRNGVNQLGFLLGIDTTVIWTTEAFDGLDEFNLVTNRLVPKRAGYYSIYAQLQFVNNIPAGNYASIRVYTTGGIELYVRILRGTGSNELIPFVCGISYLTPADGIWINGAQDAVANATLLGTADHTYFCGHRLS